MNRICGTCHFRSPSTIKHECYGEVLTTNEYHCLRSRWMSFPAYGQDGKSIIVNNHFGCNQWKEREPDI